MPPTITDADITRIANRHDIDDREGLRKAINEAGARYEELLSSRRPRISGEQINEVQKFAKAAVKLEDVWNRLPEESRYLIYFMAHSSGSKFAPEYIDFPDQEGPPFGYLDFTGCGKLVNQAIAEIVELSANSADGYAAERRLPNIGLRGLLQCLEDYWENTLGKNITFTHTSSKFENFARDVTEIIDKEQAGNVKGIFQVMRTKISLQ
jgi:hypothetical protein